ncbi:MAG TPA: hypothetical protein VEF53_18995 [Patescibacteria group bacterium]|nr:hypothetical protein [Patescibacteria group bacterium]
MAKHSIGIGNEVAVLRKLICDDCLKGIITEGLKRLSEEDRNEIISEYVTVTEKSTESQNNSVAIEELSRQELIDMAKEKGIQGSLNFMKTEKLIEELKKFETS